MIVLDDDVRERLWYLVVEPLVGGRQLDHGLALL
jgi:hypothetical protein